MKNKQMLVLKNIVESQEHTNSILIEIGTVRDGKIKEVKKGE